MSKYVGNILTDGAATGYSCGFNGSNKLTASANAAFALGTGDFTVEAWVYPPATQTSYAGIVEFSNTTSQTSGRPQLAFGVSNQIIWATDAATIVQTSVAISSGQWTHLAVARSSGTTRLFVNGALITSASDTTNYNQYGINIGLSYTTYFNGSISNLRIVKGTAVYTAAFTPPTQLFAITNTSLLTCQQPTIIDTSSNAFAITNTGGVTVSNFSPFPAYQAYNPASGGGTPGIWSLNDAAYAAQNQSWAMYDPYWKNTTLLLNGENAANAAQNNTFLDSSTNNFTITRNGNTTQGTFSPYGNLWSNYFDGTNSRLSAASNAAFGMGTGNFTFEFWLYYTGGAGYKFFFSTYSGTSGYIGYGLQIGTYTPWVWNEGDVLVGNTNITLNTWQHHAVVRNGSTLTIYLNGVSIGSTTWATDIGSSRPMNIGWNGANDTQNTQGYFSNFRVVKGTALYTSNFIPSATPLTAVSGTSLLTCQSNRFIDNSSNNFAITVNGNTSVQRFSPFNPTAPYSASTIGGSGYFDGNGDYLSVANGAGLDLITNPFTVELWYYQTVSGDSYMFGRGGGDGSWSGSNGHEYLLFISGGTLYWMWNSGGNHAEIYTTAPAINQWHHVAVSYNGTTTRMWIDGVSIGTSNTGYYLPTTRNITYINNSPSGSGTAGTGYISNLRVVNGSAVYNPSSSTITVPTAPLTAITNTSLLTNFTNAGIPDAAMQNDLETVGNAQVSTSVKKYGTGSLAFDGTGDRLQAPVNPNYSFGTGDFTIEWWVYVNSWTVTASTVVRIAGSSDWVCQYNGSGVLNFYNGATTVVIDTAAPSTSTWTHFAIVRNGTTVTLYRDGTSRATATHSSSIGATNSLLVGCGGNSDNNAYCLNGYIDDLRITKGIARYTANFTPPTSSLQNL